MDAKQFMIVASALPSNISILLRGDHGIGKSSVAQALGRLLAKQRGIPGLAEVIDRRLSQMTEGDIIGLPSVEGGVTKFCSPDWLHEACVAPRLLLLDELNRATQEVMQAAFQLVLDREINGMRLHPDTVVVSAINTSGKYNVNDIDPALQDRFFVVDFFPTTEDWIDWAKNPEEDKYRGGSIPVEVIDFIRKEDRFLDPPKDAPMGAVTTSRRSWARFGVTLSKCGIDLSADELDSRVYSIALGFLGVEAAAAFTDYVKNREKNIKPTDILDKWGPAMEKRVKESASERISALINSTFDYIYKSGSITPMQTSNLKAFAHTVPAELCVQMWTRIAKDSGEDNTGEKWAKRLVDVVGSRLLEIYKPQIEAAKR